MTSAAPDPLIGRRFGSYVVQRKLGEGGMGAVYELVHPQIGKRQALKVLHAEFAKKQAIVQRFFDEARAVVKIGHPNIVDITDYATLEDDTAYIVMEFLEGQSLAGYAKQRGPMSPAEVAELTLPICDALAAAHAQGIVHRDLKPENVHLVPRPDNPRYVKVLDFGIAKLSGDPSVAVATKTGQVMGTPMYMSPEQAMGRTKEIDHRTDIYALGIMMYQLFVGELPFNADSFGDLMLMHLTAPPPALSQRRPDLPPPWEAIINRALAKNRDERFASMAEFAAAIRQAAAIPVGASAHGYAPGYATGGGLAYASSPQVTPVPMTAPTPTPSPAAFASGSTAPSSNPSWGGATTPPARSKAPWIALAVVLAGGAVAAAVVLGGKKSSTAPSENSGSALASGGSAASGAAPIDRAALIARGEALYRTKGCIACHALDGSALAGPPLGGTFGGRAELTDGRSVVVDDSYLRESIVAPQAKTRAAMAGLAGVMPTFDKVLATDELDALVAYTASLPAPPPPPVVVDAGVAVAVAPIDAGAPDAGVVASTDRKKPDPIKKPDPVKKPPIKRPEPCASMYPCGPTDPDDPLGPKRPDPRPRPAEGSATLRVAAVPWGNVTINGKSYGQTPVVATVPAGKALHVVVENPDLQQTRKESVILDVGQTRILRYNLNDGS